MKKKKNMKIFSQFYFQFETLFTEFSIFRQEH